jgi:bifunctional ADP-heptose synthase (sugar kinase/adenylyltransferase)
MLRKILKKFIDEVSGLNVLVAGETIVDEFIPVSYEGQSMKSFCPAFRIDSNESIRQQGGAAAIANHLRNFVKKVELVSNDDSSIVKTRYVDAMDGKKHVEVNSFFYRKGKKIKVNISDFDVVIVADFGHGFCDRLDIKGEIHLMCQTNSNNFGFNRVSKWKAHRKKSVCIDLREASLQMNRRISNPGDSDVKEIYGYEMNAEHLFITVGREGSIYTNGRQIHRQPVFPSRIVDTLGAGDAFFSFSSLLCNTSLNKKDYLVVPSLAASLSTTWLCNEQSITRQSLLKHAGQFV